MVSSDGESSLVNSPPEPQPVNRKETGDFFGGNRYGKSLVSAAAVLLVTLLAYLSFNPSLADRYNHFVYLSVAFHQGRLDVPDVPEHYQDISVFEGKKYLPFPPAPAVVLMPFTAVMGTKTPQTLLAQLMGALNVALLWVLLTRYRMDTRLKIFSVCLFAFGTVHWSAAMVGSTWYFAHLCAILFTFLAWLELEGRARGWLVGLLWSFAFLSRLPLLLVTPLVIMRLRQRKQKRHPTDARDADKQNVLQFGAVLALALLLFAAYNNARFHNPFETGLAFHGYATFFAIPFKKGLFNLAHIPQNIDAMLLHGFTFQPKAPFFKPSPEGLSIFLTTPAIVRLAFPRLPYRRPHRMLLTAIGLVMIPSLTYFSTGWVQWGYRYSLDWWPFAIVLLALSLRPLPGKQDWALLAASAGINILGLYWIRVLGW